MQGCHRVTSTCYRDKLARGSQAGCFLSQFIGRLIKRRNLKSAHWPVPHNSLAFTQRRHSRLNRGRSDIQHHFAGIQFAIFHHPISSTGFKLCGGQPVSWQDNPALRRSSLTHNLSSCGDHIRLHKRGSHIDLLCGKEGIGHTATQDQHINFLDQMAKHTELG